MSPVSCCAHANRWRDISSDNVDPKQQDAVNGLQRYPAFEFLKTQSVNSVGKKNVVWNITVGIERKCIYIL